MISSFKIQLVFILLVFITTNVSSQEAISFEPKEVDSYRIDEETYNFYWHKNYINSTDYYHKSEILKGDTLPYFVDDREYKGIYNYEIEHVNLDHSNHILNENFKMFYLNVKFEGFTYDRNTDTAKLSGNIKGGWFKDDINQFWIQNRILDKSVKIFVGQKKDTVNSLF
jgi:hypothetical protein